MPDTEILQLPTDFVANPTWTAPIAETVTGALDTQALSWIRTITAKYPDGVVLEIPDNTSWAVSGSGVISPGAGVAAHSTRVGAFLFTSANVTVDENTAGFEASAGGLYLFAVIGADSWKTGEPTFALSDSATYANGILIASDITTDSDSITAATDARVITDGVGGGSAGHVIKDEGTPLTARSGLNFKGDSVAATDDAGGDETEVTINHLATAVHSVAQPVTVYKDGVLVGTQTKLDLITGANMTLGVSVDGDVIEATFNATQTAGYGGTSVTSLAIGTGSKTFTTEAGLAYVVGSRVRLANTADTAKWMEGVVTSYAADEMIVLMDATNGSGTLDSWNLSIAGQAGATGATGAAGATYGGTSTSSVSFGVGSKTFTTQAGLAYTAGARVRATSVTDTTKWMEGIVSSYSGTTLTIFMDKFATGASGTVSSWTFNLTGEPADATEFAKKIPTWPGTTTPTTLRRTSTMVDTPDQGVHITEGDGFVESFLKDLEGRGDATDWWGMDRVDGNDNDDGGIFARFMDGTGVIKNAWYLLANFLELVKPISFHTVASITTPSPGQVACGIKTDNIAYLKDENGIEIALNGSGKLSKSVAGSSDVTLTAAESLNGNIELTGVLTGNINVIVPTAKRMWRVYNATSGAFTLTVKTSAGTGIAVTQGSAALLESNGTNVVAISTGGASDLDDLGDVIITAPSNGEVLKYNGSEWVNDTDAGGASLNAQTALFAQVFS